MAAPLQPGSHEQLGRQNHPQGPSSRFYSNKCSTNELDDPCDNDNDNKSESLRNIPHSVISAKRLRTLYAAVSTKHYSIMAPNDVFVLGIYLGKKCSVSDSQMSTTAELSRVN